MNFKSFLITELQEFNDLYNIIFEGTGKTLEELLKVIPSDRNRYFLKKRQEDGNSGSFLQFVDWNEKNDYIRLINALTGLIKMLTSDGNLLTNRKI